MWKRTLWLFSKLLQQHVELIRSSSYSFLNAQICQVEVSSSQRYRPWSPLSPKPLLASQSARRGISIIICLISTATMENASEPLSWDCLLQQTAHSQTQFICCQQIVQTQNTSFKYITHEHFRSTVMPKVNTFRLHDIDCKFISLKQINQWYFIPIRTATP